MHLLVLLKRKHNRVGQIAQQHMSMAEYLEYVLSFDSSNP